MDRGAPWVELPNWYDPDGAPLRIELEPGLGAQENAERYFHRYRRATASAEAALERIPEPAERVSALAALDEKTTSAEEAALRRCSSA